MDWRKEVDGGGGGGGVGGGGGGGMGAPGLKKRASPLAPVTPVYWAQRFSFQSHLLRAVAPGGVSYKKVCGRNPVMVFRPPQAIWVHPI